MLLDMTIAQLAELFILFSVVVFVTLAILGFYSMSRSNAAAHHQQHKRNRPTQRHQDENPWT